MAFLDNSGDIILDAVLTDTGRFRLAKGDGSFKIVKFALADDEINYRLYDKNNPSGSAYYDLEIMQTPLLEAFTNNTSTMNYKLLSIPRTNLLYLPMMVINGLQDTYRTNPGNDGYAVAVTQATMDLATTAVANGAGVMNGEFPAQSQNLIRIDQGIDNAAIGWMSRIDQDLKETQFIIEIDSRLGAIYDSALNPGRVSFIDDDNIASYYVQQGGGAGATTFVTEIYGQSSNGLGWPASPTPSAWPSNELVIRGPTGPALRFGIRSSIDLVTSDYLFEQLGGTFVGTSWGFGGGTFLYIDTIVKVTGATTGYRLDLPIRFVKQQ